MSEPESPRSESATEKIIGGGAMILVAGILGGAVGWLVTVVFSREDIGIGADGLGLIITILAFGTTMSWISGGMHQAISKYISESLVESQEKALRYARAGFLATTLLGTGFSTFFIIAGLFLLLLDFFFGLAFIIVGISTFLAFFRDVLVGNLTGLQRFDYLSIVTIAMGGGVVFSLFGLLFIEPISWIVIAIFMHAINILFQIIAGIFLLKKAAPYKLKKVFGRASIKDLWEILRYGIYSSFPMLILLGTIYAISTMYLVLLYGVTHLIVATNGLIMGYAGVMASACLFGWPQVPAISEAHACDDQECIDSLVKTSFRMGFNFSVFFLALYLGQAYGLLQLFHGPEYLIGFLPFLIQSVAVVFIGLIFLSCSLLIGLGEAKKAFFMILIVAVFQLVSIPIFLLFIRGPYALLVGPLCLLTICLIIFPISFHLLFKRVTLPKRLFIDVLWKGAVCVSLAIFLTYLFGLLIPYSANFGYFFLGVIISLGLFFLLLILFGGFSEDELDYFAKIPKFGFLIKGLSSLNKKSPFYKEYNQKKISSDKGTEK